MWNFSIFLVFQLIILVAHGLLPRDRPPICDGKNFRNIGNAKDDFLIYGITQDCQMFFLRPSQLHLLSTIKVNRQHSFCYANLVQLHVKSHDTLLLTFKQASNRICTLEVHIPTLSMIFGDHLFRYSLLNSLPYASCSYSKDQSFQLEPDLSFMDPVYNDVIYFIDSLSTGKSWKVLQFLLKETGNMNMMNNLTIAVENKDSSPNEFIVSLDNQRDKLYRRNRFDSFIHQQCAFEMLFRPKDSEVNSFETPSRGFGAILNGQSVDGELMVYVETDRSTDPPTSRLNMLSTSHPENLACLAVTSFSFDVGIIRESTIQKLKIDPRPPFGTKVTPSISSKSSKLQKTSTSSSTSFPTTSRSPSTSSIPSSTLSTASKPKGAYSPSKSFFSYEMGGQMTSTSSTSEFLESNEIPVEEIEKEQEEYLNEIIKELRTDEDIGEMKTREIASDNPPSENSENSGNANATDSEAEAEAGAVKLDSRNSIILNFILAMFYFIFKF